MRSKVITSLTLILFLFSSNHAQFANSATAKAGGVCPKEKTMTLIKGIDYKCSKTGKKLTWQKNQMKIAAPAKPSATATPTSTPTPTPTSTPKPQNPDNEEIII